MGYYKVTFLLPFFIMFIVLNTQLGNSQTPDHISGFVCNQFTNFCVHGKCKHSNDTLLPHVDCDCNPGWKKLQIAKFTWPACLVPDCTIDFDCGVTPPPTLPTIPNNTTCIWCADGNCVKDGDANVCKCNQGSANLFNKRDMPCFKECYFGADCNNLGFGLFGSPPPPPQTTENGTSVAPPSSTTFGPNKTGQGSGSAHDVTNASRARQTLAMLFVVGIFLSWF